MTFDMMSYPTDLHGLYARLQQLGLPVEIEEHRFYARLKDVNLEAAQVAGTHRLLVSSPEGPISIIRGFASLGDFEVMLGYDPERFPDEESCAARIMQLLRPPSSPAAPPGPDPGSDVRAPS